MSHLLEHLLAFGRTLRRAGIEVHPGRMLDLVDALGCIDIASRDDVYHTARALLVHRQEQIPVFDKAFDAFWRARQQAESHDAKSAEQQASLAAADVLSFAESDEARDGESATAPERAFKTWSRLGGVADKDFAACTPQELDMLRAALSRLAWTPGERRTRRWIAGAGGSVDVRRAVAGSRRTGGDVIELPRRGRLVRPRPLVLLCDVSGSMERYSRLLLLFAQAVSRRSPRAEAFLFSTRLTRVTRELRLPAPDAALAAVSRAVPDWSGGTRIGAAIREFHQRWARRVLTGSTVVLLISDGWDRGNPGELRDEIARLQRSSHRLIWLNPLIGSAGYEPLTRGLRAALPFVDDFLPARTLNNFGDLARHLNTLGARPNRRQAAGH